MGEREESEREKGGIREGEGRNGCGEWIMGGMEQLEDSRRYGKSGRPALFLKKLRKGKGEAGERKRREKGRT